VASSTESLIFPAIEPYASGYISTSSDHNFYYEACGNPLGSPVVVLHGGPGSGCTPTQRRYFDPAHYRIILFDQRGCGRSAPAGCIEDNTTSHLLEDIESLRKHLGITYWLVFGGSWGSALAIAYASMYAECVSGLILRGIFLATPRELHWFLYESRRFFPEAWDKFAARLGNDARGDILAGYRRLVFGDNFPISVSAARDWNAFESAIISLLPSESPSSEPAPDLTILARARIQLHYLVNGCFLGNTPLIEQVAGLRNIPAIIIQGRYDMVCPPSTAYELHLAWPEAAFHMIPDAGHAAFEPGIAAALVQATENFKQIK
jgi:proline iminopeptidase